MPLLSLAQRLIKKHGRKVVFVRESRTAAGNPWEGTTGSETTENPYAVFLEPGTRVGFGETYEEEETRIRSGLKVIMVAGEDLSDINSYDIIRDNGIDWKIKRALTLRPGNSSILHQFYVEQ